jgi:thioredoxin-like negative regulator of GroEL
MFQRRLALHLCFASLLMLCGLGLSHSPARAQSPEDVVEQARQAAATNDNREAARLFEQAMTLAPERRRELLLEYADQVTYSGRPAEAVPLYRELLTDGTLDAGAR